MRSSAVGAAARMARRSFRSAARWPAGRPARYSPTVSTLRALLIRSLPSSARRVLFISLGCVARGEPSGRLLEVDLLDENALLAVGQVRLAPTRRIDQARRRLRESQSVVDAREVDRVLEGAARHRLLVVRRIGIAPSRRPDARAIAPGVLGVEHDLRAPRGGPADGLGIPPSLVADRDSERHAPELEDTPPASGNVLRLLARIELDLGLDAEDLAALVDDRRRDLTAGRRDALDSEDHGEAEVLRLAAHVLESAPLLRLIPRPDLEVLAPEARQVRLGKTDDRGVPLRGVGEAPADPLEPVVETRRDAGRGEGDGPAGGRRSAQEGASGPRTCAR